MLLYPWERTWWSRVWVVSGLPHAVSSGMASSVLPRFQPGCIAATVAMALPGWGDVDGDTDGDALADRLGEGDVVASTLPVQATPLSANEVGAGLLPVHEPLKPKETVAFVAMAAL